MIPRRSGTPVANGNLRIGRFRLGKLFEMMSHDAACWRHIAERHDTSEYIRVYARERSKALDEIAEKAQKRFNTRTEGR